MKIPDKHSAITTISICARKTLTLSLIWLTLILVGNAQSKSAAAGSGELYDTISSLDSSFFEAYNKCELAKIDPFFTDDVEFYHEKHGLISTRKSVMQVITKNLCGSSNKVRRELVEGSLQVYAIKGYGALEIGEHRFYLTQKGQKEKLDGIGKFANLWQKRDGKWRMSRVFSYGF
ncbi:MAG TPA: nuclear transport factor 2 family protein [Pyrinomonadaceae bacterium]|nr:nuclear transport factor 2 family protein [Pyrinomonadaceae bacterium]